MLQAIAPLMHAHPDRVSAVDIAGFHVHVTDEGLLELGNIPALKTQHLPHPVIGVASGMEPDGKDWVLPVLLFVLAIIAVPVTPRRQRCLVAPISFPSPPHVRPASRAPPAC